MIARTLSPSDVRNKFCLADFWEDEKGYTRPVPTDWIESLAARLDAAGVGVTVLTIQHKRYGVCSSLWRDTSFHKRLAPGTDLSSWVTRASEWAARAALGK